MRLRDIGRVSVVQALLIVFLALIILYVLVRLF